MAYMSINHLFLKPGEADSMAAEVDAFLAQNDPETTGLVYDITGVSNDGRRCIGITIWRDAKSFADSGARWDAVMESLAHRFDAPPRRDEMEIVGHNLPMGALKPDPT